MGDHLETARVEAERAGRAIRRVIPDASNINIETVRNPRLPRGPIEYINVRADFADGTVAHISRIVIKDFV
jgi:hypothetical protein